MFNHGNGWEEVLRYHMVEDPIYTKLFLFVGLVEEKKSGESETVTKHYTIGGMMVAMHDGSDHFYMASDHLSSASLMMDTTGTTVSSQRSPFAGRTADLDSAASLAVRERRKGRE